MAPLTFRHAKVQRVRRLLSRRTARESEGAFVLEGAALLREALATGHPVESVYVAPSGLAGEAGTVVQTAQAAGARIHELAHGVLERIAQTATPQPVVAVVPMQRPSLSLLADATLLVICVDVRDPGNAGTIIRSAEAAGADGVVCCGSTVDIYNPKCVRASMGALFHVPVVAGGDPAAVLEMIGSWGLRRLGTAAEAGEDYSRADLRARVALVLGNEAHGLDTELQGLLDGFVHIPMAGRAESLNVSMASAVLCFEAARQRRVAFAGAGR